MAMIDCLEVLEGAIKANYFSAERNERRRRLVPGQKAVGTIASNELVPTGSFAEQSGRGLGLKGTGINGTTQAAATATRGTASAS